MLNTRKTLFPLQNVSAFEAIALIGAAATGLVAGTNSTTQRTRFEELFAAQLGNGEAVGFPSGRSALAALLTVNGVKPGDEVLLDGFGFLHRLALHHQARHGLVTWALNQLCLKVRMLPDILQFRLVQNLEVPERVQHHLRKATRLVVVQFHLEFGECGFHSVRERD